MKHLKHLLISIPARLLLGLFNFNNVSVSATPGGSAAADASAAAENKKKTPMMSTSKSKILPLINNLHSELLPNVLHVQRESHGFEQPSPAIFAQRRLKKKKIGKACKSTVITFDDVCNVEQGFGLNCSAGVLVPIPNGYYGLNWENMCVLNITGTRAAQAATSGEFVATACNTTSDLDVFGFPVLGGFWPRKQSVSLVSFQVSALCPPNPDPSEDWVCVTNLTPIGWMYNSDLQPDPETGIVYSRELVAKELDNEDFGMSLDGRDEFEFAGPIEVNYQENIDDGFDSLVNFRFQAASIQDDLLKYWTFDFYYDDFVVVLGCNSPVNEDNGSLVNNLKCTGNSFLGCKTNSDCDGALGCGTCAVIPSIHGKFLDSYGNKFCVGE